MKFMILCGGGVKENGNQNQFWSVLKQSNFVWLEIGRISTVSNIIENSADLILKPTKMPFQQIHEGFILWSRKYFRTVRKRENENVSVCVIEKWKNINEIRKYYIQFCTNWAFCSRIRASLHNNCFIYSMDHTSIHVHTTQMKLIII